MDRCAVCGDVGWVIEEQRETEVALPCPECQVRLKLSRLFKAARIPSRYFDRGFDIYSAHHPSQEKALRKAIDFVESYPDVSRGLLLAGSCGVGKTHLAVAIAKALIQEKLVRACFVDEAELLRRLQYSYGPDSPDTEREVLTPLMEVELLVWDDLGTGRPTEWVKETIQMVLNHRYTYQKNTLITTNWPLRRGRVKASDSVATGTALLEERIGARLFSRIMEMCETVEIQGPDYRKDISKAGMDFHQESVQGGRAGIPKALLSCPKCASKLVDRLDQTEPRGTGRSRNVEISCLCRECANHFLARYFLQNSRLEYPREA